ncbi:MAG: SRPBCC family protein [Nodosilinea sp. LVE1205-7]|jgi:hypothetical protein
MKNNHEFLQCITIAASPGVVEHCITNLAIMHRWLNPALRCEPVEDWSTEPGAQSRFIIAIPIWQPTLISTVIERLPNLITWQFEGFFRGQDRWQWHATDAGTQLTNRFEFTIAQPIVEVGFKYFAAHWTRKDMEAQLQRIRQIAENQS